MFPELGTPLFESNGHAIYELFIKVTPQTFTQWGYLVHHPDQSFSVFNDKVHALQYLDKSLNHQDESKLPTSSEELILQEDMTSSPSTSSLITTD